MSIETVEASVKHCYSTWSKDYYHDYYTQAAAYPPIHRELIRKLLQEHACANVLDAGCGPASMLRDLVDVVPQLYGFDLTPEMVAEAKKVMADLGTPSHQIWEGSVLDPQAFLPPIGENDQAHDQPQLIRQQGGFDSAICVGVLPHVPAESDIVVMQNLASAVKPGGLVVAEARNQLFSLFTLNRYSAGLFASDLIDFDQLKTEYPEHAEQLDATKSELSERFRMDLPPIREGKEDEPGYDEVLSRTHNPFEMIEVAKQAGLEDVELQFYHYHALPPMFEKAMPQLFRQASLKLEQPHDWRGHFMASAFLVCGRRPLAR